MIINLNDFDLVKAITKTEAKAVHKDLPPGGAWRTIKGHHIYVKDGKILAGSIPGVTKAKKMTKQQMSEHQATMDKGANKGTKKNAKSGGKATSKASKQTGKTVGNGTTGKGTKKATATSTGAKKGGDVNAVPTKPSKAPKGASHSPQPQSSSKPAPVKSATAVSKPSTAKSGAEKIAEPKGKANGTTKVGAKTNEKAKPATESNGIGKPVQSAGDKKAASEGGTQSQPATEEVNKHYDVFHGTRLYKAKDIVKDGFHLNGTTDDFGNAAYFKSPHFDDKDHKDYQDWLEHRRKLGVNIPQGYENRRGHDTANIVKEFAGSNSESAVLHCLIPKEHLLDCTNGRPKELQDIIDEFTKNRMGAPRIKTVFKHILGENIDHLDDEAAINAYHDRKDDLSKKWGDGGKFMTNKVSPYEVYAKKYGVKAIVDKLDDYQEEGWQIGVYDPKIIQIKDQGWGIEYNGGAKLLKALMKALAKAKAAGYCLIHHTIDDEGLHLHVGVLGSPKVPDSIKKSLMKFALESGSGDVSDVYAYQLRNAQEALVKGLLTADYLRKLGSDHMQATEAGRNAYRLDWTQVNPNDDIHYIPLNRLRRVHQTEQATNWDKVRENVGKMERGEGLAPIVIGYDHDILDGQHRWEASNLSNFTHVPCVVMRGTNDIDRQRAVEGYKEIWKSLEAEAVDRPQGVESYSDGWKSLGKEAFEDDERFVFRGVGLRELHFIQKHGYIQSKGKGNDDDKGTSFTCFSTRFGQAEGYARGNYALYNEKMAFVIALPKPAYMRGMDGEVSIRGQIPTDGMKVIPVPKTVTIEGGN